MYLNELICLISAACGEPSETGPCTNYSVMWYFDHLTGDCTRFWYGGCDGNGNRFATQPECKAACMEPEGLRELNPVPQKQIIEISVVIP